MKSYLALGVLFLVACGSSTDISSFNSNSNCLYNVTKHVDNPWLLKEPEIHFDFWGDWSSQPDFPSKTELTWNNLVYYSDMFQKLSEYGIKQASLDPVAHMNPGSTVHDNDGGSTVLDDSSFSTVLNDEIQASILPYPDDNTIYVIMLPPNVSTAELRDHGWSGYHSDSKYGSQRYTYAVISYGNNDSLIAHEVYEAATDPDFYGYYDTASNAEVGDLCENHPGDMGLINGYKIQKVWSEATCSCL